MASERCAGRRPPRTYRASPSPRSGYRSWHASLNETTRSPFLSPSLSPFSRFPPPSTSTKNTVDILDGRQRGALTAPREALALARGLPRVAVIHHVIIIGVVAAGAMFDVGVSRALRPIGAWKAPVFSSRFSRARAFSSNRAAKVHTSSCANDSSKLNCDSAN